MRSRTIARVLNACTIVALFVGCNSATTNVVEKKNAHVSIPVKTPVSADRQFEFFVFVAFDDPALVERVAGEVKNLALCRLSGGSVLTIVDCPSHRPVAVVDIPYGTPESRKKNVRFGQQYLGVQEYFQSTPEVQRLEQLGLSAISETVRNLRRTELPCRILLCGTPVFDDPTDTSFSMVDNVYPSDGLIGHPQSPFVTAPPLPSGTEISWLTNDGRWGSNHMHRQHITRFHRAWFNKLDGHIVRMSADPTLTFSFSEPYFSADIALTGELPVMKESKADIDLAPLVESTESALIDIKRARASFQKLDSLAYKIEMAGGNVQSLKGESIAVRLVWDGSGSMSPYLSDNSRMILQLAEGLPAIVESFDIGIAVHRDGDVDEFPITQILDVGVDGGQSLKELKSFLASVDAEGSDAVMSDMLTGAMEDLSEYGDDKRHFLMLVADYVDVSPKSRSQQIAILKRLRTWAGSSTFDRRVVALYCGEEQPQMEKFFRAAGASNSKSFFTRRSNDLIDSILEAAMPLASRVAKKTN